MAEEADTDSSEVLKHISTHHHPLFSIPGLFADAGRSPTSPLDFGVFANFGGLFSPRSSSSSSPRFAHRNRWVSDKVGLSVLSSTIDDDDAQIDSFTRDNVVLAPQIKFNTTPILSSDPCVNISSSLPKNFAPALSIHPSDSEGHSASAVDIISSSSPVDIISTQPYSYSLSGREMALSEDYTCIISHGPNPKTTHIFGDCILDCDPMEFGGFDTEEEIEKPQGDSLPAKSPVDSIIQLCLCTGKPQDCHIHRAEKEDENVGVEDSMEISPGSSYNEDLFPMAMPINP